MTRDELLDFSASMEMKLRKRDGYGGWRTLPLDYLVKKLKGEMDELIVAIEHEPASDVMNEAVDLANYCMFIWDIMRSRPDTRTNLVVRGSKDKAHE